MRVDSDSVGIDPLAVGCTCQPEHVPEQLVAVAKFTPVAGILVHTPAATIVHGFAVVASVTTFVKTMAFMGWPAVFGGTGNIRPMLNERTPPLASVETEKN